MNIPTDAKMCECKLYKIIGHSVPASESRFKESSRKISDRIKDLDIGKRSTDMQYF